MHELEIKGMIYMKIKISDLIKSLETIKDKNANIYVSSDEEWNTIYTDLRVQKNSDDGSYVIFGLSGSELDDY